MARFNLSDLKKEVSRLNQKFKKSDKTYIKFGLMQAYGGNQVILKSNRGGGGATEITSGFESPTKTMEKLFRKSDSSLKREVDSFHKYVASYTKRVPTKKKRVHNKPGKMA